MTWKAEDVCDAMKEASITDPESQNGKDFCIDKCPYDHCVVMEPLVSPKTVVRIEKKIRAKAMRREGMSVDTISKRLGKNKKTIQRYLSE